MDREIKFRVWDNVDYLSTPFTLKDVDTHKIQFTNDCVVMQYVGIKDKNNKEIYEGDILTAEEYIWKDEGKFNYHGEVVFQDAQFMVKAHCVNPEKQGVSHGLLYDFFDADFEVIGNIYQNPELLHNK